MSSVDTQSRRSFALAQLRQCDEAQDPQSQPHSLSPRTAGRMKAKEIRGRQMRLQRHNFQSTDVSASSPSAPLTPGTPIKPGVVQKIHSKYVQIVKDKKAAAAKPAPEEKPVDNPDLSTWLNNALGTQYSAAETRCMANDLLASFTSNRVAPNLLPYLSPQDWQQLVPQVGPRVVLVRALNQCRSETHNTIRSPPAFEKALAENNFTNVMINNNDTTFEGQPSKGVAINEIGLEVGPEEGPQVGPPQPISIPDTSIPFSSTESELVEETLPLDIAQNGMQENMPKVTEENENLDITAHTDAEVVLPKLGSISLKAEVQGRNGADSRRVSLAMSRGTTITAEEFDADVLSLPRAKKTSTLTPQNLSLKAKLERDDSIQLQQNLVATATAEGDSDIASIVGSLHSIQTGTARGVENTTKYPKVSFSMLQDRSRFSNHPMIDNVYRPPPDASYLCRVWQCFAYEVLRLLFLIKIIWKNGLRAQDFILSMFPLLAAHFCLTYNIKANISPSLWMTMIIFPLSFAVNAAYNRRENALQDLAKWKSNALSLYLTHHCWKTTQDDLDDQFLMHTTNVITNLFRRLRIYLTEFREDEKQYQLEEVYKQLCELSLQTDMFRLSGIPPPMITRPIHDLKEMIGALEALRVYSDYRTPSSIRSFIKISTIIIASMLSPYFAWLGRETHHVFTYISCSVFFFLLSMMCNVQQILENPFLTSGRLACEDDINLEYLQGVQVLSSKKRSRAASRNGPIKAL